jgi:hypothetical protein
MSLARADDEPQLTDMLKSKDKVEGKEAIKAKTDTLTEKGTGLKAQLPVDKKTFGSNVVLKSITKRIKLVAQHST